MTGMRLADKVLVHQAHPAKVGADVTASLVSNILLWRGQPKTAVAVRILVSVAGSAAVLSVADLDALAKTRRGQYVLEHMPLSAQAIRLADDALMGFGAHRRSRALLLAVATLADGPNARAGTPSLAACGERAGAAAGWLELVVADRVATARAGTEKLAPSAGTQPTLGQLAAGWSWPT